MVKVLGIIPARGGSKGIPKKNIYELNTKPLIFWTIQAAQKSKLISQTILSSEDSEIIKVAKSFNCDVPFIRPADLAKDESTSIDVIIHALECMENFDYIVILQCTSPLRSGDDIDGAISLCIDKQVSAVISVTEIRENPYLAYTINAEGQLKKLLTSAATRRQDLPVVYYPNGAVYVFRVKDLLETRSTFPADVLPYYMPRERSIDIDTYEDMALCEYYMKKD